MGQDVRNDSRVCRTPPGPMKDLTFYVKPNPVLVAVSLMFILMTSGLVYYWMRPPPIIIIDDEPIERTPHAVIAIDGDANFSDTALLEGWPGDGSPENPFIINGLHIDLGGEFGHCIDISNTRVSFTIRNCNLTGAYVTYSSAMGIGFKGAGIHLLNASNGELVNNTCNSNIGHGISISESDSNFVVNNTCNYNRIGIYLDESPYNAGSNNTCLDNTEHDIIGDYMTEEDETEEPIFDELAHQEHVAKQFVWFLAGFGMVLVVSVVAFVQFRRMEM